MYDGEERKETRDEREAREGIGRRREGMMCEGKGSRYCKARG